jgi:K+ transporter
VIGLVVGFLFFFVLRVLLRTPLGLAVAGAAAFLVVDLAFLAANLRKVAAGGWFPLAIAAGVFVLLMTWQKGREIVTRRRTEKEGRLLDFVTEVNSAREPIPRVPGAAVFLNANKETTPLALRANLEHNHVLHHDVVILTVEMTRVPHVRPSDRVVIDHVGFLHDDITHVTARFGFQDEPDLPGGAAARRPAGPRIRDQRRGRVVLPLADDARADEGSVHAHVAQAAVRRARPQLRRPGSVLPAARGPHGGHGVADRVLMAPSSIGTLARGRRGGTA